MSLDEYRKLSPEERDRLALGRLAAVIMAGPGKPVVPGQSEELTETGSEREHRLHEHTWKSGAGRRSDVRAGRYGGLFGTSPPPRKVRHQ